jgi:hypothetical protein
VKQKWGAVVQHHDVVVHDWVLCWRTPDGAVAKFLDQTPLIFRDGDSLSLLQGDGVAVAGPLPAGLRRRFRPGRSGPGDLVEVRTD